MVVTLCPISMSLPHCAINAAIRSLRSSRSSFWDTSLQTFKQFDSSASFEETLTKCQYTMPDPFLCVTPSCSPPHETFSYLSDGTTIPCRMSFWQATNITSVGMAVTRRDA